MASASLTVRDDYHGTGNELQALVRQEKAEKLARARAAAAEAAATEAAKKAAKQAAPAVPSDQVRQGSASEQLPDCALVIVTIVHPLPVLSTGVQV